MAFRPDRLTIKSQEALQAAQDIARERGQQELTPEHLLLALVRQKDGVVPPILQRAGASADQLERRLEEALDAIPKVSGGEHLRLAAAGQAVRGGLEGGAGAQGRVRQRRAPAARGGRGRRRGEDDPERGRPHAREYPDHPQDRPRDAARDRPGAGRQIPGARALLPRPDRRRARRQARPGDRPRRGNPPRDAGAQPPHEEQPRADRRSRRRQDRHRRRAGAAHRRGRRARRAEEQARARARPGRADRRAPSSAASSRTA